MNESSPRHAESQGPPEARELAARGGDPEPPMPAALLAVPEARQIHLDVRDDIRRGEEPFGRIMAAVKRLGDDQVLVLRAPFEPIPLYRVLARRGLSHWTQCRASTDWWVWFYRDLAEQARTAPARDADATASSPGGAAVLIDVRGLEPPEPMVRILEQLDVLVPGAVLEVLHERRPMFLYPQLEERGFLHETDEPAPGLVRIRIRHGDRA